jgi:hypothetical protein
MKKQANNPAGKNGKPITLAPMSFEDAVKKMLETQPPQTEPKATKPPKKVTPRK